MRALARGGGTRGGEAATASATQASCSRSRRFHRLSDRCLLIHPGLGTDPLTARAALLHRRRAAQGTRQAATAARATAAARAFVGGPAGAPRQCAALTAHAALMSTKARVVCSWERRSCFRVFLSIEKLQARVHRGCPCGVTGLSIRYQGELLGLWDPQNRDLRRKLPPETMFSVG